jgi:hypothetical protein
VADAQILCGPERRRDMRFGVLEQIELFATGRMAGLSALAPVSGGLRS